MMNFCLTLWRSVRPEIANMCNALATYFTLCVVSGDSEAMIVNNNAFSIISLGYSRPLHLGVEKTETIIFTKQK